MQTQIDRHTLTFIQSNSERCEVILINFQAAGNFVVYCARCFFNTQQWKKISSSSNKSSNQSNQLNLAAKWITEFFYPLCLFHSFGIFMYTFFCSWCLLQKTILSLLFSCLILLGFRFKSSWFLFYFAGATVFTP